jgi:hypothetical protein
MTPIQPVHEGDTGPKVTTLHVGLQFLIGHQGNPPNVQQTLLARLAPDVSGNVYREATRSMVALYQAQLKNWPNYWPKQPQNIANLVQLIPANTPGDVDAGTAQCLNWLVETFRRIASPPPHRHWRDGPQPTRTKPNSSDPSLSRITER